MPIAILLAGAVVTGSPPSSAGMENTEVKLRPFLSYLIQ